jgi:hypothetical protein
MKNKISIVIQALTLLFTAAILVILLIPQSNHVISSDSDYVATTISNERAMRDYKLKIGEKYISVSNDKITKSSYSKHIVGEITNSANQMIYGVSVHISFYQNNRYVDVTSAYCSEIPANTTVSFDVYAPDEFTTYSIDYATAYFLD